MRKIDENLELADRLKRLRQQYPGDFSQIAQYERELEQGLKDAAVMEIPIIKKFIDEVRGRVNDISTLLSFDRALNSDTVAGAKKRLALFHERDAHLFWLRRFSAASEDEIIKVAITNLDEKIST